MLRDGASTDIQNVIKRELGMIFRQQEAAGLGRV